MKFFGVRIGVAYAEKNMKLAMKDRIKVKQIILELAWLEDQ